MLFKMSLAKFFLTLIAYELKQVMMVRLIEELQNWEYWENYSTEELLSFS